LGSGNIPQIGVSETIKVSFKIIRPHIVVGGFLGYCLGVLLALVMGGETSPSTFFLGYGIILFGDLSTHFSNDFYDVKIDKDTPMKPYGGSNILVKYPEIRPLAFKIALILSTVSILTALVVVYLFDFQPWIFVITLLTNLFGWFYSAPPIQLNTRRLGEATIALGTGFSIPAIGFLTTGGNINQTFLVFTVPFILYGFILSLSLELPDLEVDKTHGRNNLVVLLGRRKINFLILLTSILASIFFFALALWDFTKFWFLPFVSLLPVISGVKGYSLKLVDQADADYLSRINISFLFICLILVSCYFYFIL
jgi:1,4-dihydroxy-2-naphthoate octaprenyltransferase